VLFRDPFYNLCSRQTTKWLCHRPIQPVDFN